MGKISWLRYIEIAAIFFLLLVALFIYYNEEDYKNIFEIESHIDEDKLIVFNLDSGMYNNSISVSLTKNWEIPATANIYYTLNGDDPTSEQGILYNSEIILEKTNNFTVYPIKAAIYYKDCYSDIYERTYILCDDITNEFNITIACITCDSKNLYDYETGIFVEGKSFDEWVKINGNDNSWRHANYSQRGEEWIRDAHITMFGQNGDILLDQKIGMGISGGTSSIQNEKSLKLYADEDNKIEITLENQDNNYLSYSMVDKYNSIRLRSGSQDFDYGNIRSAIASRLAQNSGFDGITSSTRCIVFLNGEFYDISDIQQNYSPSYLTNRFGLYDSQYIEKAKGNEAVCFMSLNNISDLFKQDLNKAENRSYLEEKVDMENYLLYYALQVAWNNTDWPNNNFEFWKYTGKYNINNSYTDGRYRFLIYDTDCLYHNGDLPNWFSGVNEDVFIGLMEGINRAKDSSFKYIMNSDYYRDKFVTIICDLFNTSFSTDNVLKILEEENERIKKVRIAFYDSYYENNVETSLLNLKQAIQNRQQELKDDFKKYFDFENKYTLELEVSNGVYVTWNNMKVYANHNYSNNYYYGTTWELTANEYPGYEFQYWEVNGKKIISNPLKIEDDLIKNDIITIKAIAIPLNEPSLIISELSANGTSDWIKLYNAGAEDIKLIDWYLSDNMNNLDKYRLPEVTLKSGENIVIYGSKNYETIGDYICNFSLSQGEVLTLSHSNKIYDEIVIPKMSEIESYGRYDNSNDWVYFKKKTANLKK